MERRGYTTIIVLCLVLGVSSCGLNRWVVFVENDFSSMDNIEPFTYGDGPWLFDGGQLVHPADGDFSTWLRTDRGIFSPEMDYRLHLEVSGISRYGFNESVQIHIGGRASDTEVDNIDVFWEGFSGLAVYHTRTGLEPYYDGAELGFGFSDGDSMIIEIRIIGLECRVSATAAASGSLLAEFDFPLHSRNCLGSQGEFRIDASSNDEIRFDNLKFEARPTTN